MALLGVRGDSLPLESSLLRTLAVGLGMLAVVDENPESRLKRQFERHMTETRATFERLFLAAER